VLAGLELDGLTKRFGSVTALDGVSFSVEPGQIFGFVGPNGAGKTTAMRIVLGIVRPDAGSARWRGTPIDRAVRRRFGYMPEERGLYPKMTAGAQLTYLARLHGLEASAAAAAARRWCDELGLGDRVDEPVERLSLGNQQRVQLAAALVHDPELLVLDEPFSGLDPLGVETLAASLRRVADSGVAVLFSSHQLELVERLCDAVAIVARGRVVASGAVGELGAGRPPRWTVRAEGFDTAAVAALPGVAHVADLGDAVEVELADDADDQELLDAIRARARVLEFRRREPTLAELFRAAVE
jgi:ABC-2 type transport system ATP-binding protein